MVPKALPTIPAEISANYGFIAEGSLVSLDEK